MTSADDTPLDEIQWRSPEIVQRMGGIHTNTVLPYFAESPFFDKTSNNASITTQAFYRPDQYYLLQTREAFEGRLRSMAGLEFMVVQDPSNNGKVVENSGVWVIRKQNRRKNHGREDELTPLSAYFVIGENIYMAPSVGNILASRLLSTVTSLTSFLTVTASLPLFSPAFGHSYIAPTAKAITPSTLAQNSKETTPMPLDTQSTTSRSQPLPTDFSRHSSASSKANAMLSATIAAMTHYGGQYMDETPLIGEPGSFKLATKEKATSLATSLTMSRDSDTMRNSRIGTPVPPPLKIELPPVDPTLGLKTKIAGGRGDKSPITPGTGMGKKRKKSQKGNVTPMEKR